MALISMVPSIISLAQPFGPDCQPESLGQSDQPSQQAFCLTSLSSALRRTYSFQCDQILWPARSLLTSHCRPPCAPGAKQDLACSPMSLGPTVKSLAGIPALWLKHSATNQVPWRDHMALCPKHRSGDQEQLSVNLPSAMILGSHLTCIPH